MNFFNENINVFIYFNFLEKMADISKSEFMVLMEPILSGLDAMKDCNHSAKDVAEAMFREAAKNTNTDKITRKQFDAINETKIGLIVAFFVADKDKSGFVDKVEMKAYLKKIDAEFTDDALNKIFDFIEIFGEVKLKMNEFINLILGL
jgi:hypothetical protein